MDCDESRYAMEPELEGTEERPPDVDSMDVGDEVPEWGCA